MGFEEDAVGQDCTAIPDVSLVGCAKGKCVISAFNPSFLVSDILRE